MLNKQKLIEKLCQIFNYKEIGWKEIGETFYRWELLRTPFFRIYLHYLVAPIWHPQCHDHPWNFFAFILWGGYSEMDSLRQIIWRSPLSFLYRPANFVHNVKTDENGNWSIVIVGKKKRNWKMLTCGE